MNVHDLTSLDIESGLCDVGQLALPCALVRGVPVLEFEAEQLEIIESASCTGMTTRTSTSTSPSTSSSARREEALCVACSLNERIDVEGVQLTAVVMVMKQVLGRG